MRQAIVTKFHGPTNSRGPRVSAKAEAGRIMLDWDHRIGPEDNHRLAAQRLAARLGWKGSWQGGALPGAGYAFVMIADEADFTVSIVN